MSTGRKTIPIWGLAIATLTLGTLLFSILATVTLDAFLEGPGPASVTTRVPGLVYAVATVMKVCMVTGLVLSVIALARRVSAGGAERAPGGPDSPAPGFPVWGIASITLAPLAPFVGAIAVVMAQSLSHAPESLSMLDMSRFSRTAVIVMLLLISAGVLAGVTSLVRRERSLLLPVLGVVVNAVLIGLFWHFRFYAIEFDQDMWAPH
jgi:hypothetical protein